MGGTTITTYSNTNYEETEDAQPGRNLTGHLSVYMPQTDYGLLQSPGKWEHKTSNYFVVSVSACLAISLLGSMARILFQ